MGVSQQTYAIVAYSKSGNKFVIKNGTGVMAFDSAWTDQGVACQDALGANYASNFRGYASDDTTNGPWRPWTGN